MQISSKVWNEYVKEMSAIEARASDDMKKWLAENVNASDKEIVDAANFAIMYHGETSASRACNMYDKLAELQGVYVPQAEPAEIPKYGDVVPSLYKTLRDNSKEDIPKVVAQKVKQMGQDTMLLNALRDGAQFAWIPSGTSCDDCLKIAARGWQYMSKNALINGHAEHIHANCDCQYAVRFDETTTIETADTSYANCKDVTEEWLKNATPNSHNIEYLEKLVYKNKEYFVDGKYVRIDLKPKEKNVVENLKHIFGGKIKVRPRVLYPQKINSADLEFRNELYDIKCIEGKSKHTLYNAVKNKEKQANNFILDISTSELSRENAVDQVTNDVFRSRHTRFVKRVILFNDKTVIGVFERN